MFRSLQFLKRSTFRLGFERFKPEFPGHADLYTWTLFIGWFEVRHWNTWLIHALLDVRAQFFTPDRKE